MSKLTDLEICKKIALIEGRYTDLINKQASYNSRLVHVQEKATIKRWFNPLTDDALCFRLMVKHKITVEFTRYYESFKSNTIKAFYSDVGFGFYIRDISPNKAICLAIIESKKSK